MRKKREEGRESLRREKFNLQLQLFLNFKMNEYITWAKKYNFMLSMISFKLHYFFKQKNIGKGKGKRE